MTAARETLGRVLVLMPTSRDAERMRQLFEEGGIEGVICSDLAEVCRELRHGAGALLLTDDVLRDDQVGRLAETMRARAPWSSVPLIVVAREGTSHQLESKMREAPGSLIVVERPVRMRPLLSLTRSALHGHAALIRSHQVLSQQAEQLQTADRRKDEFLATLAHELRNPLAPIRAGLDLLGRGPGESATARALQVMDRQLKHMVRLIDDLLDVSRITQGRLELVRVPLALGKVIDAAVEASRPHLERNRHELCVTVEDRDLVVDADLTRMAQVVGNLLNNASKYTAPGGLIRLSAWLEGDEVVLEVADNGMGIPENQLTEVFEMFSQVNRTLGRAEGGLGIGLALVRKLVHMHGGRVSARSDGPRLGSVFTLRLPLAGSVTPEEAEPVSLPAAAPLRKRVLIVDDNEDAAEMLALMLRQAEYDTTQASDGLSALAAVASFTPDVVILDIGLPGMSGYEVARLLRSQERAGHLELIALTGWGSREDKQKAIEAGFDLHLTKPVEAGVLYRALAELEQRDSRSAAS